jgi:hypothetical protein
MRRSAARHAEVLDNVLDNVENAAVSHAMKATLSYTLPDEARDFRLAMQGSDAVQLLSEIEQRCRSIIKHEHEPHEDRIRLAEEIRRMIHESSVDVDA